MASSLALKRLTRIINPIRSASVAPRFFGSSSAQVANVNDDDRRSDRSVSRRDASSAPSSFFSDVFDPFSPTRSLNQMLNLVDQLMDIGGPVSPAVSQRRGWDVKEDNESLHLRMDMPGVDKKDVKISVENNTLIIKGEGEKDSDEEERVRRYSSRLDLPQKLYKVNEIKAEMKNGVLKIKVPKVKEEERKDVYEVKVD